MMIPRIFWGIWALVPVAAITYHFGPGQSAYVLDKAARLQNQASATQTEAQHAQDAAYATHLVAIEARRLAFIEPTTANQRNASQATATEESMYAVAAKHWKQTAERFQDVLATLGDASPNDAREMRWAKARASVRAGEIWTGIDDLESLIGQLDDHSANDQPLERAAREELATAYYYGARLLRLSGMPPQEWRVESGKARQHFRYLAENSGGQSAQNFQRNLELVLNLEQTTLSDLQGKPLPKESPRVGNTSNRKGNRPGKSPRPPRQDGRGAGGAEEILDGW